MKETCQVHPRNKLNCFCLDQNCKEECVTCIKCFVSGHKACDQNTFLYIKDIKRMVQLDKRYKKYEDMNDQLDKLISHHRDIIKMLLLFKREFVSELKWFDHKQITSLSGMRWLKQNCDLTYLPESDTILATPFAGEDQDANIQNASSKLIHKMDCALQQGYALLQELADTHGRKLEIKPQIINVADFKPVQDPETDLDSELTDTAFFSPEQWNGHKYISLVKEDNQITFFRNKGSKTKDYFVQVYEEPLSGLNRFKVTIKKLGKNDSYFGFGIINHRYDSSFNKNFGELFNSEGCIYYTGYQAKESLQGHIKQGSNGDPVGYEEYEEFMIEYKERDYISFYNENRTLELSQSLANRKDTFYLFIEPAVYKSSCMIERLL